MRLTKFNSRFIFISSAILLAAMARLLPHLPNVTPVAAMALFGTACFSDKRIAFIVPLIAMFLSDIFIGFHSTMIYVYGSFIITSFIGLFLKNKVNAGTVLLGSLISSIFFFLITNFGVWASENFVGGSAGMLSTYELGLPFFRNSLLGDLFFNGVLFGSFYLAQIKFPKLSIL